MVSGGEDNSAPVPWTRGPEDRPAPVRTHWTEVFGYSGHRGSMQRGRREVVRCTVQRCSGREVCWVVLEGCSATLVKKETECREGGLVFWSVSWSD